MDRIKQRDLLVQVLQGKRQFDDEQPQVLIFNDRDRMQRLLNCLNRPPRPVQPGGRGVLAP